MTLYFDTYAILAVLRGSPAYEPLRSEPGVTHQMNLLEAAVQLARRGVPAPFSLIDRMGLGLVGALREDLEAAAGFKLRPEWRARNLSYIDALGYALALRLGRPFLTGDAGFRGLPGVQYVTEA